MDTLRGIIVDDEASGREILARLLGDHCPDVDIVGVAKSASEARKLVADLNPEVVFLDVMMPTESGFEFLDGYENRPFSVIFVTAYHEHAIQAIKASAVDYLLKPIDVVELREAVQKLSDMLAETHCETTQHDYAVKEQPEILLDKFRFAGEYTKVILHRPRGIKVAHVRDILYIRSDAHYTTVRLVNDGDIVVTGSLKDYEEILAEFHFCRIHKSHLINLMHVTEYSFSTSNRMSLSNGEKLIVSKRRTREFLTKLNEYVGVGARNG